MRADLFLEYVDILENKIVFAEQRCHYRLLRKIGYKY